MNRKVFFVAMALSLFMPQFLAQAQSTVAGKSENQAEITWVLVDGIFVPRSKSGTPLQETAAEKKAPASTALWRDRVDYVRDQRTNQSPATQPATQSHNRPHVVINPLRTLDDLDPSAQETLAEKRLPVPAVVPGIPFHAEEDRALTAKATETAVETRVEAAPTKKAEATKPVQHRRRFTLEDLQNIDQRLGLDTLETEETLAEKRLPVPAVVPGIPFHAEEDRALAAKAAETAAETRVEAAPAKKAEAEKPAEPVKAAAPVAAPALEQAKAWTEVYYQDLKAAIPGFKIKKKGIDPNSTLQFYGFVKNSCLTPGAEKIKLATEYVPSQKTLAIFVKIGDDCLKDNKAFCESKPESCTKLSQALSLDLRAASGDRDVKLALAKTNRDLVDDETVVPHLQHLNTEFKSTATIEVARAEALEREQKDRIAVAKKRLIECRRSSDDLVLAREALDTLLELGQVTEKDYERKQRELQTAELKLIQARARKATAEELDLVREELAAWAASHPEAHNQVAQVYRDIAVRYAKSGPQGLELAMETIQEAGQLENLSDSNRFKLEGYERDMKISALGQMAQGGSANNFMFVPAFYQMTAQLQDEAMHACNQDTYAAHLNIDLFHGIDADAYSPSTFSMERCAAIMASLQKISQLPMIAQQADYRRSQMQYQIQMALSGAQMGGGQQMGFPVGSNPNSPFGPMGGQPSAVPGSLGAPLYGPNMSSMAPNGWVAPPMNTFAGGAPFNTGFQMR